MAGTVTHSVVQQFASMKPTEFGPTIEPKWQVGERLLKEVKASVEKGHSDPPARRGSRDLVDHRGDAVRLRRVHLARDLARDVARVGADAALVALVSGRGGSRAPPSPLTVSFAAGTSDPEARISCSTFPDREASLGVGGLPRRAARAAGNARTDQVQAQGRRARPAACHPGSCATRTRPPWRGTFRVA